MTPLRPGGRKAFERSEPNLFGILGGRVAEATSLGLTGQIPRRCRHMAATRSWSFTAPEAFYGQESKSMPERKIRQSRQFR